MLQCQIHSLYHSDGNDVHSSMQQIPALQRRRLSRLAKMALHSANMARSAYAGELDYIVWSSKRGDENTTLNLLFDVCQGQSPSPMQFSTSVHNAIAGLYSILYADTTTSISISSRTHCGWADALCEAYGYLRSQQKNTALVVYYDERLPELYQSTAAADQDFAVAAVISLDAPNLRLERAERISPTSQPAGLAFYQFWQSPAQTLQHQSWIYQKC